MEDTRMSKKIRIRVSDFYKNAVGEIEYIEVSEAVYEALAKTFRREAHAEEMRDLRHVTKDGYVEGDTEDLLLFSEESLEDYVIRRIELENMRRAMKNLSDAQKERLQMYFFEGLSYRQMGEKLGISHIAARDSVELAIKKIRKNMEE